jgi:MFS family permease
MTRASWFMEVWRWILTVAAVVVAFFGVLYFSLFVLFFGPFPKDLAEPTAGFLMGSLIVLAGSMIAPRRQFITAIFLFVLVTGLIILLLSFHAVSAFAGGLLAVAFVGWWFHPSRRRRSTVWVGVALGAACLAFLSLVYARHVDRPAHPEQLPTELIYELGTDASGVAAFYRYDLGGFIDHEWLWRIDAKPDIVARVVSSLRLRSTNTVPPQFWRMPPHYWPRSMPPGGEAFQSSAFSADSRGPDGAHYFLVHDKR